jgi:hypothetical protein
MSNSVENVEQRGSWISRFIVGKKISQSPTYCHHLSILEFSTFHYGSYQMGKGNSTPD